MQEICSGNSIWTMSLTKNGTQVCKISFLTEILAPTEQTGSIVCLCVDSMRCSLWFFDGYVQRSPSTMRPDSPLQ